MLKALPSNRVAALAAFVTGLAGCATSLVGVWPSGATNEIALLAGSAAAVVGPISHVIGSILWDRTPAGQAVALQNTSAVLSAAVQPDDSSISQNDWRDLHYQPEQPEPQPKAEVAPEAPAPDAPAPESATP